MDLNKRTYILVTGASRGIGREISLQLAQRVLARGSVIVLLARDQLKLNETKSAIIERSQEATVLTYMLELAEATQTEFEWILKDSMKDIENNKQFERAIIIHNAGTLGDTSLHARKIGNTTDLRQYFQINLFSTVALNCEFMRVFADIPKLVVNLSTKAAVDPIGSFAHYCSVKAAREMYFRVLATEENDIDTLVLNYAPGVINTDMSMRVEQESHNQSLVDMFRSQRETETMLTTGKTVLKLIAVLEAQKFKSGDHVDYWD